MKFKAIIFLTVLSLSSFTLMHKFYISVTEIEYFKEKESLQITSKIFIDDFEELIGKQNDKNLRLKDVKNSKQIDFFIEKYLTEKIKIKVNGKDARIEFRKKEFDLDVMKVHLEINGIHEIHSFQIFNKILFDLFDDQQNMVKLKINTSKKSYLLTVQKDNAVLNFD